MNLIERIIFIIKAWWNHKKQTLIEEKPVKKEVKKKHPVEIFPELAYWKVGDKVKVNDCGVWRNEITYKGVNSDGGIVFKNFRGDEDEIYKLGGFGWGPSSFKNLRIRREQSENLLSDSEYMKDIHRFQELIKQEK